MANGPLEVVELWVPTILKIRGLIYNRSVQIFQTPVCRHVYCQYESYTLFCLHDLHYNTKNSSHSATCVSRCRWALTASSPTMSSFCPCCRRGADDSCPSRASRPMCECLLVVTHEPFECRACVESFLVSFFQPVRLTTSPGIWAPLSHGNVCPSSLPSNLPQVQSRHITLYHYDHFTLQYSFYLWCFWTEQWIMVWWVSLSPKTSSTCFCLTVREAHICCVGVSSIEVLYTDIADCLLQYHPPPPPPVSVVL